LSSSQSDPNERYHLKLHDANLKYEDDEANIDDRMIEHVSYEENQELLRAFGGQAP
jgi:hypothetical protein